MDISHFGRRRYAAIIGGYFVVDIHIPFHSLQTDIAVQRGHTVVDMHISVHGLHTDIAVAGHYAVAYIDTPLVSADEHVLIYDHTPVKVHAALFLNLCRQSFARQNQVCDMNIPVLRLQVHIPCCLHDTVI